MGVNPSLVSHSSQFVIAKLFYTWGRGGEGAGDGPDAVELLSQDFPTAEAAAGPAVLLGSLDRADYLPPPAAAPAPTDVAHLSIGPPENAGYVTHFLRLELNRAVSNQQKFCWYTKIDKI